MTPSDPIIDAGFATAVVAEAALLAKRIQSELVTPALVKGDKSPVTVADFAVQALVSYRLTRFFGSVILVGEERADELRQETARATLELVSKFVAAAVPDAEPKMVCEWIDAGAAEPTDDYWTLDPIDGTKGFLRREQYAVALAHVWRGQVRVGVLGCPELMSASGQRGLLFSAIRGQGAWTAPLGKIDQSESIRASAIDDPKQARLLRSVESGHTDVGGIASILSKLGSLAPPVPMDSQAKYAVLASGGGEIVMRLLAPDRPNYREKIWDQAAGSIVVEESGGRITDLDGKPLDFSQGRTLSANRGVLATNGRLHEAALEAVKAIERGD